MLADYAPSARERTPRGARVVHVERAGGAQAVIPPLLRENPNFRRFFIGQSVSLLGDQITAIALPLTAVLALHATAGQMGALTTAYLSRTCSSRCTPARGSTGAAGGGR